MDIDLYINSVYHGFHPIEVIENYRFEYFLKAVKKAYTIDWDEVVLYAIYSYDAETGEYICEVTDHDQNVVLLKGGRV